MTRLENLFQDYLEARRAVCEFRDVQLRAEIDCPTTTWARRTEAIKEQIRAMIEWCALTTELEGRRLLAETDLQTLRQRAGCTFEEGAFSTRAGA